MSINALHTAATGLSAMSTSIDVTANNLANISTNGFKASRVNFEDLLYMDKAQPGVHNANGDERPAGVQVGLGVRVANTDRIMTQGSAQRTDNALDVMIDGEGFFQVNIGNGRVGYTRAGNFFRNSEGDIVLGNSNGPLLEPPINIPEEASSITITADGRVVYYTNDDLENENEVGNVVLANFVNPKGLLARGGNILEATEASGPAIEGEPGNESFGKLLQGFVESSNVNPVKELVSLIQTQRAFEMNSQSIQAADQSLQVLNNLRRF